MSLQTHTTRTGFSLAFRASALAAAFCITLLLLPQGRASAAALPPYASVTASRLVIRRGASNGARSVATAAKGDVLRVLAVKGSWYQVTDAECRVGWCLSNSLAGSDTGSFKPSSTALLNWPSDCVDLTQIFTYARCMQNLDSIAAAYPGLARVETIGTTVMGNPIKAIVLGNPGAGVRILVQAEIHAREYISAIVALRQAETMLRAASMNVSYSGVGVADILNNVEIWVVPMANPDGEMLVTQGIGAVPASMSALRASLLAMNKGSADFTRWKANANGVDLNRNFDAGWKVDPRYKIPGPENYAGPAPFSEPESMALRDLANLKNFALTLSYHTSGKMIYWYDPGCDNSLNQSAASDIHALTGYRVLPPSSQAFDGGFRDWYADSTHRTGMTVEFGSGYCPLPMNTYPGIWLDNRFLLLKMAWNVDPKALSNNGN